MLLKVLLTLLLVAYPFIVYFGLQLTDIRVLIFILAPLLLLRLFMMKKTQKSMQLPIIGGLLLLVVSFVTEQQDWLLFYPVLINSVLFFVFAYSLKVGPSMIERFAKLKQPDLPDAATPYLIKVTQIWCLFFLLNGGIAFYTATMTDIKVWSLYNGFISYLLSGLLLAGEWLYRKLWIKQ